MTGVTGVVLTYNEAPNIARTLERLAWLPDIVVVDSGSSDDTREIAARFPNVRVFVRPMTTLAAQWTYAIEETGITTEWVLALDADYIVTDGLAREIQQLTPLPEVGGYRAAFDYCVDGRPLRCGAYPPVTVLYRRAGARYEQDGHAQRVRVQGEVRPLIHRMHHDDRKSLSHWLGSQANYMRLEAEKLCTVPASSLGLVDRLRRWLVITPVAMFVYCYFVRLGVLDGRAGLYYSLQRAAAEVILSLFLLRRRLDGR